MKRDDGQWAVGNGQWAVGGGQLKTGALRAFSGKNMEFRLLWMVY
ncbi:MAG: hypothetical protein ABSA26_06400 [Thermoguttaceae bacterium]|jgi:hypothetical protein